MTPITVSITLNHQFTPDSLASLNNELASILVDAELDEARLLQVISHRDKLVTAHLDTLSGQSKTEFATAELEVNKQLVDHVSGKLSEKLAEAIGLKRGLKAVKHYK